MAAIGPVSTSIFQPDTRPFVGTMTGPAFTITRASRGRNSFRPLVRGRIEPSQGGSRVEGTMELHLVVAVFLGFLLLVPGWLLLTILSTGRWDTTSFAVAGAMVALVVTAGIGFKVESRRTLADLTAIVEGEIPS
jgi:hypothetical protein